METEKVESKFKNTFKAEWFCPKINELEVNKTLAEGGSGYDYQSQASASL